MNRPRKPLLAAAGLGLEKYCDPMSAFYNNVANFQLVVVVIRLGRL